jgi:hypothetical protein
MDAAYHMSVPVYKVNFDGKSVYDMMKIYMVIDIVFTKLRITKVSLLFFSPQMDEIMLCSLYCLWQQITPSKGLIQKFVMCSLACHFTIE